MAKDSIPYAGHERSLILAQTGFVCSETGFIIPNVLKHQKYC